MSAWGYNPDAVNAAIRTSRQRISKREARAIHALLKGRTHKNPKDTRK